MFPIGVMYYFGTNLDHRFSVPDFWPKPSESHRIPFEREDAREELERLKRKRLERRARRLEAEGRMVVNVHENEIGNGREGGTGAG